MVFSRKDLQYENLGNPINYRHRNQEESIKRQGQEEGSKHNHRPGKGKGKMGVWTEELKNAGLGGDGRGIVGGREGE